MNKSKIEETVEKYELYNATEPSKKNIYADELLTLAKSYLEASEVMPEKKEPRKLWDAKYENGYNQAIQECTLIHMKIVEELKEEINRLMASETSLFKQLMREGKENKELTHAKNEALRWYEDTCNENNKLKQQLEEYKNQDLERGDKYDN